MYKERLSKVGHSQIDLLLELKSRFGETKIDPSVLSKIFRGVMSGPMSERIISETEIVLKEWEQQI